MKASITSSWRALLFYVKYVQACFNEYVVTNWKSTDGQTGE